jgi:MFS family permease
MQEKNENYILFLAQSMGDLGVFLSLDKAIVWMFISTVGMLISIMVFGILADKIGRKKHMQFMTSA